MTEQPTSNRELRAGSLRRQIARHSAYRRQIAAQTEQRLRRCEKELTELGFEVPARDTYNVSTMDDTDLEALATGALPEA